MAIITISLTGIGPYFLYGVPRQVELETNIPAIMFYTLDGSEPSFTSPVYISPIDIPTDMNTVRLRVLAVSGPDTGVLDVSFGSGVPNTVKTRRVQPGKIIDAYGVEPVLIDGYGLDAYGKTTVIVRESDYALQDLDVQYSRTGPDGIGPGTMITLGPYPPEFWEDHAISTVESSPNKKNVFFNPKSLYVVIDGRDGYEDEAIYEINSPHGSMVDDAHYMNGKNFYNPYPLVSGGLVRQFINYETGTIAFYYHDNLANKWIKSIQKIDLKKVPQRIGEMRYTGTFKVIPWIYNKRSIP